MNRVSQLSPGSHSSWPLPANDSRESMSLSVSVFVVNPSRRLNDMLAPIARRLLTSGPETFARVSKRLSDPNGTVTFPPHSVIDGRAVEILISPPSAFRPNSALCGPRTNSTCATSRKSKLVVFALNCGTPSTYVTTPGLDGPAPTPRMRGLLSLRAVNSVKWVFGEKIPASATKVTPAALSSPSGTAVIATGSAAGSAGSLVAVTVMLEPGTRTGVWACGVDCEEGVP